MLKVKKYLKSKILCLVYKMLNLSLKELRLVAKNRNISGYKSLRKDKLSRIINNNKGDIKNLLIYIYKKKETKKVFIRQQERIFLNQ